MDTVTQKYIQSFDDHTCDGITVFIGIFLRSFDQPAWKPAWKVDNDFFGIA